MTLWASSWCFQRRGRPPLTPLLDRWTAQLLRGGVRRRAAVRTPVDAGHAVVALVAAAVAWSFGVVREPLGWQLTTLSRLTASTHLPTADGD
jgi:sugar phosphate permease